MGRGSGGIFEGGKFVELKGKNILITGASSGIDRALALESAKRGANLCIGARRIERLEEIKKKIEKSTIPG